MQLPSRPADLINNKQRLLQNYNTVSRVQQESSIRLPSLCKHACWLLSTDFSAASCSVCLSSPGGIGWSPEPAWHSHPASLLNYCGSSSSLITAHTPTYQHTNCFSSHQAASSLVICNFTTAKFSLNSVEAYHVWSHVSSVAEPILIWHLLHRLCYKPASRIASSGKWRQKHLTLISQPVYNTHTQPHSPVVL